MDLSGGFGYRVHQEQETRADTADVTLHITTSTQLLPPEVLSAFQPEIGHTLKSVLGGGGGGVSVAPLSYGIMFFKDVAFSSSFFPVFAQR